MTRRTRVVNGEPALAWMVGVSLERVEHVVAAATSGADADEALASQTTDLVISAVGTGSERYSREPVERARTRRPGVQGRPATDRSVDIDSPDTRRYGVEAMLGRPNRAWRRRRGGPSVTFSPIHCP
jgi:hypothetical protein